jgi:hypothetical protein
MNNVESSHIYIYIYIYIYNVSASMLCIMLSAPVLMSIAPMLCIILSAFMLCSMLSTPLLRIMWIPALTVASRSQAGHDEHKNSKNRQCAVCLFVNVTRQSVYV